MAALMREVVLTGVGHVGPTGAGLEALSLALDAGDLPLGSVATDGGFHLPGHPDAALLAPDDVTKGWIKPLIARRMSKPSRMAVCAGRMAVRDAGLADESGTWEGGPENATCFGTAWGGTNYTLRLLEQIETKGPEAISPFLFMETVANAAAGQVALDLGLRGPNLTLTQREASGPSALVRAASLVASGRAERVFAAAVDEVSPILHGILCRFGAVSSSGHGRPFDAQADGFVPSEGVTLFVLEAAEVAAARGARVHAKLSGWGRANDPSATPSDWGTGSEHLAGALGAMLDRLAVTPDSIARIVSGASGAARGDRLEREVLEQVFGSKPPAVITPKALVGEYGGGFLASSLWAAQAQSIPSQLMPLGGAHQGTLAAPGRTLVSCLSSGGPAAWFLWERP